MRSKVTAAAPGLSQPPTAEARGPSWHTGKVEAAAEAVRASEADFEAARSSK